MPLDRPRQEGPDALVDLLAQARDLALRDAGPAHRLDQVIDRAGRDAVHVRLLDDRRQRLLGRAARLQERGEVGAFAQLRDGEVDPARPANRLIVDLEDRFENQLRPQWLLLEEP